MKKIFVFLFVFSPTIILAYIIFTPEILSFIGEKDGGIALLFWIYLICQTTLSTIFGLKWCKKQVELIKCRQYSESTKDVLIAM
jgi:hypothetical protein